ncbi:MAG: hypothetical protein JZU45_08020 [Methyloversatilis discipulorum]|uniref:hypothetical protein n=1 Tax=Methyloversatilis discipulorum TaxID=1119528 RepID=UPI0026EE94FD|nr:hypothetical protein [Methyloversatilis discipulorum]MBV5286012.1 hypothetical protein [Methyloversatilis discipulorum]
MSDDLQDLRDAVLKRFGRNLLVCQQIEVTLKELLKSSRFEGSAATLAAMLAKRAEELRTSTLGVLVGLVKSELLVAGTDIDAKDVHENVLDDWMSHTFHISGSPDFVTRRADDLDWLLTERNALAHDFLPRWSPRDPDGLRTTMHFLDEQFARLQRIRADWVEHLEAQLHSKSLLASLLVSPELDAVIEARWWNDRPVLKVLKDHAEQGARPDGWSYVARGAELARAQVPDDAALMRDRYGVRSFVELLKAYPDFEVVEEVLPNGATRALYRMRSPTGEGGTPDEPAPAGPVS